MDEQQIRRIIQEELSKFISADKYVFQKHIQIFDGRNIQLARTVGTSIGTATTQKLSVYGVTPVVQAGVIGAPSADVSSLQTAVNAIRVALTNFGITA